MLLASVALAADVNVTVDTSTGIDLDTLAPLSSVEVAPGVNVVNDASGTLINGSYSGFGAPTTTWTLTNRGTIHIPNSIPAGPAVRFDAGGTIENYGLIETLHNNAIQFSAGGTIRNYAGGEIRGAWAGVSIQGSAGSVTNSGYISSAGGGGIDMRGGGSIVNEVGASIHTEGNSNVAAYLVGGTSRSIENAGTIESIGGNFATGIEIGNGDGSVVNQATGSVYGTYNGIYTGSSGTLTIGNAGTIRSMNGPTIQFRTAGAITNTGTVERVGGGDALTFSGNHVRTLNLGTGSQINGNVVGGTSGTDNLVLQGTGTETLSRFTNFETLAMQGTNWSLTGTGTIASSTTVSSGRLSLDGILTSPTLIVDVGATLDGSGTFHGNTLSSGVLAPGNSIGTLTLSGDVSFSAGSFFDVEVSGTPALLSDFLDVGGEAHLDGNGTVRVFPEAGSYPGSFAYRILTAANGVNGCFAGVVSNSVFFTPTLDCQANDVFVTLDQNGTAFVHVAATPNQLATAGALQQQGSGDPMFDAILALGSDAAQDAFDQLSGEIHAGLVGALREDSRYPRESALDRIDEAFAARAGGATEEQLWVRGSAAVLTSAGDGNAARLDQGTANVMVGADGFVDDDLLLGFEVGVSQTGVTAAGRSAAAQASGFHLGVYGGRVLDSFRFRGGAAYSGYGVTVTRTPALAGFGDTLQSQYGAGVAQLFTDIGYAFAFDGATLEPFGRLALVYQGARAYAETGGPAALSGATQGELAAIGLLGLRTQAEFTAADDRAVRLNGMLGLQIVAGTGASTTHSLAGGTDFTVSGATPGTSLVGRFGIVTDIAPGHSLSMNLAASLVAQSSASATAGYTMEF